MLAHVHKVHIFPPWLLLLLVPSWSKQEWAAVEGCRDMALKHWPLTHTCILSILSFQQVLCYWLGCGIQERGGGGGRTWYPHSRISWNVNEAKWQLKWLKVTNMVPKATLAGTFHSIGIPTLKDPMRSFGFIVKAKDDWKTGKKKQTEEESEMSIRPKPSLPPMTAEFWGLCTHRCGLSCSPQSSCLFSCHSSWSWGRILFHTAQLNLFLHQHIFICPIDSSKGILWRWASIQTQAFV